MRKEGGLRVEARAWDLLGWHSYVVLPGHLGKRAGSVGVVDGALEGGIWDRGKSQLLSRRWMSCLPSLGQEVIEGEKTADGKKHGSQDEVRMGILVSHI